MQMRFFLSTMIIVPTIMCAADSVNALEAINRTIRLRQDDSTVSIKNSLDLAIKVKMINRMKLSEENIRNEEIASTGLEATWTNTTRWITLQPSQEIVFETSFDIARASRYFDVKKDTVLFVRTANKKLREQKPNLRFTRLQELVAEPNTPRLAFTVAWLEGNHCIKVSCNDSEAHLKGNSQW